MRDATVKVQTMSENTDLFIFEETNDSLIIESALMTYYSSKNGKEIRTVVKVGEDFYYSPDNLLNAVEPGSLFVTEIGVFELGDRADAYMIADKIINKNFGLCDITSEGVDELLDKAFFLLGFYIILSVLRSMKQVDMDWTPDEYDNILLTTAGFISILDDVAMTRVKDAKKSPQDTD